jgi:hypothetical protein
METILARTENYVLDISAGSHPPTDENLARIPQYWSVVTEPRFVASAEKIPATLTPNQNPLGLIPDQNPHN